MQQKHVEAYDNMITPRNMERVDEADEELHGADEGGHAGSAGKDRHQVDEEDSKEAE